MNIRFWNLLQPELDENCSLLSICAVLFDDGCCVGTDDLFVML